MFAVVTTGGKQYRVAKDDVIQVEKLAGEAGDKISLKDILLVGDDKGMKLGSALAGITVNAEIVNQTRADKVIIFKKKRRQNYRRKRGHMQHLTTLRITDIKAAAKKAAKADDAAAE